jgi:apolipoprotein N-acyltransferase
MAAQRTSRAAKSRHPRVTVLCLSSLAAGALLSAAFPPLNVPWLGWIGLLPLLMALRGAATLRQAALYGWLAGAAFSLLVTDPLVTGHTWTGWAQVTGEELAAMEGRQLLLLRLVWLAVGAWGGLFWALFAAVVSWLGASDLRRLAVSAPVLFVLLPEWLRTEATWGFHWGLLGNLVAEWAWLRQLAAFGGVWPLSALVVVGNVGLLAALSRSSGRRRWRVAAASAGIVLAATGIGWARLAGAPEPPQELRLNVAAAQHQKPRYRLDDFSGIGLDRSYLDLIATMGRGEPAPVDLLVLPESIAMTVVSLDGSTTEVKPEGVHQPASRWSQALSESIGKSNLRVALGVETVEAGALHNSLTFWSAKGLEGWYHKQKLVPFSEYRPALWRLSNLAGASQYRPGRASTVVELGDLRVGSFVCQEVLFPRLLRRSVRNGAQLLVSGGNDGVFENPAVAEVHARLAQLRAVESGRHVVRAMKTGISQIIDPRGEETVRTASSETAILLANVPALSTSTPYVRFGDWFLVLAGLGAGLMVLARATRTVKAAMSPKRKAGRIDTSRTAGAARTSARFSA